MDNSHQHIKTVNRDKKSNKRLRFSSIKERSKSATADIYRAYKRRGGASSASREERVHHQEQKRRRIDKDLKGGDSLLKKSSVENDDIKKTDDDQLLEESTFAQELDLSQDRNASEGFYKFYNEIWSYTRSLPEILHHLEKIVDCLLKHMLTPHKSSCGLSGYIVNHTTTDILHLLGVLARDVRHEIHPYLSSKILPRIVHDLLNPPVPSSPTSTSNNKSDVNTTSEWSKYVVDATYIECAFRTLSYLFRYDSHSFTRIDGDKNDNNTLEFLRCQIYSLTLAHKRPLVRKLSAECFCFLIQKLKSQKEKKKHLKRVIRALAVASCPASTDDQTKPIKVENRVQRARDDALDGVALLLFYLAKGVPGRLHSNGVSIIETVLECTINTTTATSNKKKNSLVKSKSLVVKRLSSSFLQMICGFVRVEHFTPIWDVLHKYLNQATERVADGVVNDYEIDSIEQSFEKEQILLSLQYMIQLFTECMQFRQGVLILGPRNSYSEDSGTVTDSGEANRLSSLLVHLFESKCYNPYALHKSTKNGHNSLTPIAVVKQLQDTILNAMCCAWKIFQNSTLFSSRLTKFIPSMISSLDDDKIIDTENGLENELVVNPAIVLARDLLPYLPLEVAYAKLVPPVLEVAQKKLMSKSAHDKEDVLEILHLIATSKCSLGLFSPMNMSGTEFQQSLLENEEKESDIYDHGGGVLFPLEKIQTNCVIPVHHRDDLLDMCLSSLTMSTEDKKDIDKSSKKKKKKDKKRRSSILQRKTEKDAGYYENLCYITRCIPFLTLVNTSKSDEAKTVSENKSTFKKVFECYHSILEELTNDELNDTRVIISKALVLEAFSVTCTEILRIESDDTKRIKMVEKHLLKVRDMVYNKFLKQHPNSIFILRSLSLYTKALSVLSSITSSSSESRHFLSDATDAKPDEVYEILMSNLKSTTHFVRLYTLEIFDHLPTKHFVINHDDIDWSGDLDEEPSSSNTTGPKSANRSRDSKCELIQTLINIESTSLNLKNERFLTGQIQRVQILAQSERLPLVYAEIGAYYMFGLLHVKFSPIWGPAMDALVMGLSNIYTSVATKDSMVDKKQESVVWPPLFIKLEEIMLHTSGEDTEGDIDSIKSRNPRGNHFSSCVSWETTKNLTLENHLFDIFGPLSTITSTAGPHIARYGGTDTQSVFKNIWSIMEKLPLLVTKKSRMIVPLFLEFLYFEFYSIKRNGDDDEEKDVPMDVKELDLGKHVLEHVSAERKEKWNALIENKSSSAFFSRKSTREKLISFLKMFSAINGPEQLFKYAYLEQIYLHLLSNNDSKISCFAFKSLLTYKYDYLVPYKSVLLKFWDRKEFRETLTSFKLVDSNSSSGSDMGNSLMLKEQLRKDFITIDSHHRDGILPIVLRILFGRLSSRNSVGNNNISGTGGGRKDTPSSRRAFILGFMTCISPSFNPSLSEKRVMKRELDVFIYLMVRMFISMDTTTSEEEEEDDMIIDSSISSPFWMRKSMHGLARSPPTSSKLSEISVNQIIGFLNLLSDMISKLGYGIHGYIPVFYSLLVSICGYTQIKDANTIVSLSEENEESIDQNEVDDDDLDLPPATSKNETSTSKIASIRVLTYKCLTKLFIQFADSFDFSSVSSTVCILDDENGSHIDEASNISLMWKYLKPSIQILPQSCSSSQTKNIPSLLTLITTLSSHPKLLKLIPGKGSSVDKVDVIPKVFECITNSTQVPILESIYDLILDLITECGAFEELSFSDDFTTSSSSAASRFGNDSESKSVGSKLLSQHLKLLIHQFTQRLISSNSKNGTDDGMTTIVTPSAHLMKNNHFAKRELSILCQLSYIYDLQQQKEHQQSKSNEATTTTFATLCNLLIPYLTANFITSSRGKSSVHNVQNEEAILNVLAILQKFIPKSKSSSIQETMEIFLNPLAALLGPHQGNQGILSTQTRQLIVSCIDAISFSPCENDSTMIEELKKKSTQILYELNAMNKKLVQEYDFDRLVPAFQLLGEDIATDASLKNFWADFVDTYHNNHQDSKVKNTDCVSFVIPILNHCLHSLFDSDGVVVRGAAKALKVFVSVVRKNVGKVKVLFTKRGQLERQDDEPEIYFDPWLKIMEKTFMTQIKSNLTTANDTTRKYLIMLIAGISDNFKNCDSDDPSADVESINPNPRPKLHTDLNILRNKDDVEQDFFLNITHVQVHRRAKALSTLRKVLTPSTISITTASSLFSQQTLNAILLPLTLNPIMMAVNPLTKNSSEAFILEAVATTGAISRHLSWKNYNSLLYTLVNKVSKFNSTLGNKSKNSQQNNAKNYERYLIGTICSVLDGFHFDIIAPSEIGHDHSAEINELDQEEDEKLDTENKSGNSVWKALQKRILPKLESLLTKDTRDKKNGSRQKVIRAPICLALLKLIQKLPELEFEKRFPRLLLVICTSLKNRDSNVRDLSRNTLSKMFVGIKNSEDGDSSGSPSTGSLDLKYFGTVIHQLAANLSEGYQLHVRSKTLHSVLLALSGSYTPPPPLQSLKEEEQEQQITTPEFDKCVPALIDLIQQDLFGAASEIKEAKEANKRLIKEAMGSSSYGTLEIICKLIHFVPYNNLPAKKNKNQTKNSAPHSTVHAIVMPFLERLRLPDVKASTIGKINECLNKIVIGLSQNPSVHGFELLPFIHATISPFIGLNPDDENDFLESDSDVDGESDDDDSSDDEYDRDNKKKSSLKVTRTGKEHLFKKDKKIKKKTASKVACWLPSSLNNASNSKEARDMKIKEKTDLVKVRDGVSAPKLTGFGRYGIMKTPKAKFNDPATACGVVFGLSLLYSFIKKSKLDYKDPQILGMTDPFVRILTKCIKECQNNQIILLALRNLCILLKWEDLPSVPKCSKKLASYTLILLSACGSSDTKHEITQGCFKTITFLIKSCNNAPTITSDNGGLDDKHKKQSSSDNNTKNMSKLPLNSVQMDALISLIHSAVADSEHNSATFGLIKAITSTKYLSAEFYDLMNKVLKLSVQSQRESIRYDSSIIFAQFLLDYPLGKQRLGEHFKQIVLNIKYEYEDGRVSAIGLLHSIIQKLPTPLLEEQSNMMFLNMACQLVNDSSEKCRESIAKSISSIFKRVSLNKLQTLYEYMFRWFDGENGEGGGEVIQRASAQLLGILVDSRPDYIKRGDTARDILVSLKNVLDSVSNENNRDNDTSKSYIFNSDRWEISYFCMVCFEKMSRVLSAVTTTQYDLWETITKYLTHPHPWVKLVTSRILNIHITSLDPCRFASKKGKDKQTSQTFLTECPGSLYEIAQNLCYQLDNPDEKLTESIYTLAIKNLTWIVQAMYHNKELCFKENDDSISTIVPVQWLISRLSNMARNKAELRREAVFKCFAAFGAFCDAEIITPYLDLMIAPLHRAILEAENQINQLRLNQSNPDTSALDLPQDVMQVLEEKCGTDKFIFAYASVKTAAQDRKNKRKQEAAAEAIHDPETFAERKIKKQEREKERRKRRMKEKKNMIKKKRRTSV